MKQTNNKRKSVAKTQKAALNKVGRALNRVANSKRPKRRRTRAPRQKQNVSRRLGIDQIAIDSGVASLLNTMFLGTHGVTRGIAQGTNPSALCSFQNHLDFVVPAGGSANFAVAVNALTHGAFIHGTLNNANTVPAGASPWTPAATGITVVEQAGPFAGTNPTTQSWRVLGYQAKLIQTTAEASKSGSVSIAHVPQLYNNNTPAAGTYTGPVTGFELDNIQMRSTFTTSEPTVYNWFPGSPEIDIKPYGMLGNSNILSGPVVSLSNSGTTPTTWRWDYKVHIEYYVNGANAFLVDKRCPSVHPSSYFYATQIIIKMWSTCVINTESAWEQFVLKMDPVTSKYPLAFKKQQRGGFPSQQDQVLQGLEEEKFDEAAYLDVIQSDFGNPKKTTTSWINKI